MLFDDEKKKRAEREREERDSRNRDWRAIDRHKDKSHHRDEQRETGSTTERALRDPAQLDRYKKHLEQLFTGTRKPTAEEATALKEIRQARGAGIDKQCQKFVAQFGVPKDWESLLLFLDASTAPVIKPALEKLAALAKDETPARQNTFKQRLRLLAMTTGDRELRKEAEKLLTELP